MTKHQDFSEIFPVGAKVRCESEAFPGRWEYGTVEGFRVTRHTGEPSLVVKMEDGELVDYAPWYLDVDPHNSLVRLVK